MIHKKQQKRHLLRTRRRHSAAPVRSNGTACRMSYDSRQRAMEGVDSPRTLRQRKSERTEDNNAVGQVSDGREQIIAFPKVRLGAFRRQRFPPSVRAMLLAQQNTHPREAIPEWPAIALSMMQRVRAQTPARDARRLSPFAVVASGQFEPRVLVIECVPSSRKRGDYSYSADEAHPIAP